MHTVKYNQFFFNKYLRGSHLFRITFLSIQQNASMSHVKLTMIHEKKTERTPLGGNLNFMTKSPQLIHNSSSICLIKII